MTLHPSVIHGARMPFAILSALHAFVIASHSPSLQHVVHLCYGSSLPELFEPWLQYKVLHIHNAAQMQYWVFLSAPLDLELLVSLW